MQNMYPGKVNSPQTELAQAIDDEQTTIPLLDASVLPDPPNICTIGTGEDAETVLYTGVSGNDLTGVTRGFQGTARAWVQGTKVARLFTEYDYEALRQNVADHVAATSDVHGATSTATPNTIVQRDSAGRFKAATPAASDDVARKAEVDAALERASTAVNAGYNEDPNTTQKAYILTNHANSPIERTYWHIRTFFFSSLTGNRAQIAIRYSNTDQMFIRRYNDGVWAPWVEVMTAERGFFNTDLVLPNGKGLYIRDSNGNPQVIGAIAGNNIIMLGDADLPVEIRGTTVQINGNTAWHAGNLPYETGNWTPELRFGGSTEGITYASRGGQYTRIANVVYWTFEFLLSSKGSASGIATVEGLPFNKGAGLGFHHAVGRVVRTSVPSGQWLSSYIVGTTVYLATNTGSDISSEEFANNSLLRASGFYFI